MIFGNPSKFALESGLTVAFANPSQLALGFFLIHVNGRRYGVYKPDATLLANSLDEVKNRLASRGKHTAPFATELSAGKIADSFRSALYADEQDESYFGMPLTEFTKLFNRKSNNLMWAPDGDEAFDDDSYVLQLDVGDRVRLIAFMCREGHLHDPATLSDIWIPADEFYSILGKWLNAFEREWQETEKITSTVV